MGKAVKNILLSGQPEVGKTTLIMKILAELPFKARGFYTQEIRDKGVRKGFKIRTLDGREGVLAHMDSPSPQRVSKYGVNVEEFERIGVKVLEEALEQGSPVVIDEIGKMELYSKRFRETLLKVLDRSPLVIATIGQQREPFIERVKSRPDVAILAVTLENRDSLVAKVKELV